ncbi:MAG: hypothetical protein R6U95_03205 [Bacteroidales bacterium]
MKLFIICLAPIISILPTFGQDSTHNQEPTQNTITWSGFVKNDFFYDTRQNITVREGHFLLYPKAPKPDEDGKDINSTASLNFLSIQSRLTAKITGPDALGARTSGLIEGAFFGHSKGDINGFRLRHAFVKLNWPQTELLFGQYWHMMFVPECFPGTISFNTGVPFQYFSRNPQIRITQKLNTSIRFSFAAATQRDFTSPGGYTSLSNTTIPDVHGQLHVSASENIVFGITGGFKTLKPRLVTEKNYKTTQTISSFTGNMYTRIHTSPLTIKLQGIWAQNAYDGLMIGGFMITDISPTKDFRTYTPLNTLSMWTDIETKGSTWQAGIFAGFSKNMGSTNSINNSVLHTDIQSVYNRGRDIDFLYRISPRIQANFEKLRIASEVELTSTAYGTQSESDELHINNYGQITESKMVHNVRLLMSVYYFF